MTDGECENTECGYYSDAYKGCMLSGGCMFEPFIDDDEGGIMVDGDPWEDY